MASAHPPVQERGVCPPAWHALTGPVVLGIGRHRLLRRVYRQESHRVILPARLRPVKSSSRVVTNLSETDSLPHKARRTRLDQHDGEVLQGHRAGGSEGGAGAPPLRRRYRGRIRYVSRSALRKRGAEKPYRNSLSSGRLGGGPRCQFPCPAHYYHDVQPLHQPHRPRQEPSRVRKPAGDLFQQLTCHGSPFRTTARTFQAPLGSTVTHQPARAQKGGGSKG